MAKAPIKKPVATTVSKPETATAKAKATVRKASPAVKAAPAVKKAVAKPAEKPIAAAAPAPTKPAAASKSNSSPMNGAGHKPVPKAATAAAPANVKPAAEPKEKVKKPKLVRDSFTMPEAEYEVLADVKKACLKAGIAVKKSELLRIGVALISQLDLAKLKDAITALPPLKAGRPKKDK